MTNERHTRREFLGIAGAGVAGVATGASFDHKRSDACVRGDRSVEDGLAG